MSVQSGDGLGTSHYFLNSSFLQHSLYDEGGILSLFSMIVLQVH